jgi:hypothetical protein
VLTINGKIKALTVECVDDIIGPPILTPFTGTARRRKKSANFFIRAANEPYCAYRRSESAPVGAMLCQQY